MPSCMNDSLSIGPTRCAASGLIRRMSSTIRAVSSPLVRKRRAADGAATWLAAAAAGTALPGVVAPCVALLGALCGTATSGETAEATVKEAATLEVRAALVGVPLAARLSVRVIPRSSYVIITPKPRLTVSRGR